MRSGGAALFTLLALIQAGFAAGQTADLTRLTCGQFLDLPQQDGERLIVWLHGYYAGAAQRTGLDGRQFEAAMAAIRQACERGPCRAADRGGGAWDLPGNLLRGHGPCAGGTGETGPSTDGAPGTAAAVASSLPLRSRSAGRSVLLKISRHPRQHWRGG